MIKNLINISAKKYVDIGSATKRVYFLSLFFLIVSIAISMRLIDVSLEGGFYGHTNNTSDILKEVNRGNIVDRNNKLLATTISSYTMLAFPKKVINKKNTAITISKYFKNLDPNFLIAQLNKNKNEVVLVSEVSANKAQTINSLGQPGVKFRTKPLRFYPNNNLTSHLVGHINSEFNGMAGIEKSLNEKLTSGKNVRLTIDIRVQHAVREELYKGMKKFKAKTAVGLVVNINNGEVLSLVSLPDYNPNHNIRPNKNNYRNSATLSVYEMGSTFKIFTVAAALENNIAQLDTLLDARKPIKVSNFEITDYYPENRILTMREVFIKSSNIGSTRIALDLGVDRQKEFLTKLGLMNIPNIGIDEMVNSLKPKIWGNSEVATISFGHGLSVSPVQMLQATLRVINGGFDSDITLVDKNKNNEVVKKDHRIISSRTSEVIRNLLKENVEIGTGTNAKVKGYRVGGKTATAEKIYNGEYNKRKRVSSFISVFPINEPSYISLILFDEPVSSDNNERHASGGWTAAPVTANIIKRIAPILRVTRDIEDENKIVKIQKENLNLVAY